MRRTLLVKAASLALACIALAAPRAAAEESPRAVHYDLAVTVRENDLAVTTTIRLAARTPSKLELDLVPEMKVRSAEAAGKALPFTAAGGRLELDMSGVPAADAELEITVKAEGSPREQFARRVPSAVGPEMAYVRSEVAWYPRFDDELATYRTVVDAPADWMVVTAGACAAPAADGKRSTWTFESRAPEPRVGLAAGPWRSRKLASGGDTLLEALHLPGHEDGADAALEAARSAMDFYGAWLGKAALPRYAIVELPEAYGSGSGYGESGYALVGPGAFASPPAEWCVSLIAHEVAHTWWGHTVRFSEWPNEMLASFSTTKFLEACRGPDAAREDRKGSVEAVVQAAAAGKEVALADLRGFGGGMDKETYASQAYGKAKMLLVMLEDAVGEESVKRLLARFLDANRGRAVGWTELRAALVRAGPAAKTLVEQWERPGIPRLSVDLSKKTGAKPRLAGALRQEGTEKPRTMKVVVAARCGEKSVETTVALGDVEARFDVAAPSEPTAVTLDPEWRVLAARSAAAGPVDAKALFDQAFEVVSDPGQDDPKRLERAISQLRQVLEAGRSDLAGTCHVGIGRCLFRLDKLDEARKELEQGLRVGGFRPFHRSWANLRLGNIADLQKRRKDALRHYEAVVATPDAKNIEFQKGKARRFLDKPYQGYRKDG